MHAEGHDPDDLPFPGSYGSLEDVGFLLRRMSLTPVVLPERERLMQSGQRHYSEMIGPEDRPGRERLAIFRACLETNAPRFARDLHALAGALFASAGSGRELTLVSIARAGTPVGVLLGRLLRRRAAAAGWSDRAVRHYSVSVIRDRGLDGAALAWIGARHPLDSVRFVDGWTGKGTIARELAAFVGADARFASHPNLAELWAPLDICGAAVWSAGMEDYILPSSLLGGTISGLVSRSVLPRDRVGTDDFHGCVALPHLRRYDLSRWFIREVERHLAHAATPAPEPGAAWPAGRRDAAHRAGCIASAARFINGLREEFGVPDRHRVKLGLGESVRVALRRLPERLLLRGDTGPDTVLIRRLAALRAIPVETRPDLPYAAVAIIAKA